MFAVDEVRLLTGKPFDIGVGIALHQPSIEEIVCSGEEPYLHVVSAVTSEPFDVPYYLNEIGIDFEKITPFELFYLMVRDMKPSDTKLLFGDLDFSSFRLVQRESELVMINSAGVVIDALLRERIADCVRRMHGLSKNIITSCENEFTHDLLIQQQKKEIERNKRRKQMFGEHSAYGALISSLACEWHDYNKVLSLKVGQFFDAIIRLNYKINANYLYTGIYAGNVSSKDINKKDLDWMRPIKTKTL